MNFSMSLILTQIIASIYTVMFSILRGLKNEFELITIIDN